MKYSTNTWKTRIFAMFAILLMGIAGVLVSSPGIASAAGCRHTSVGEYPANPTYQSPYYYHPPLTGIAYWNTEELRSPLSSTGCRDVNIKNVQVAGGYCVLFRVVNLDYPQQTTGWTRVCPGADWTVVSEDIFRERYYIDAMSEGPYKSARPYYSIMD